MVEHTWSTTRDTCGNCAGAVNLGFKRRGRIGGENVQRKTRRRFDVVPGKSKNTE